MIEQPDSRLRAVVGRAPSDNVRLPGPHDTGQHSVRARQHDSASRTFAAREAEDAT